MRATLLDIQTGRMKLREASRHHNIHVSSIRAWQSGKVKSKISGPKTILTSEEEKQVVDWCEIRQNVAHCASLTLLKGKVKQICNDRLTPFREGIPGRIWWHGFQKRHPQLTLRRLKNLDLAKAQGLSKEACDKFYRILTTVYEEEKYPPYWIWNADESNLSARQTIAASRLLESKDQKIL